MRSSRVLNDESSDALTSLRRTDFGRDVCDALVHLSDLAYLQTHPLTRRMPTIVPGEGAQAGRALRAALLEAIEALRPAAPSASGSHAWRGYQILRLRYAECLDLAEIQSRLAIGKSEYYRDHRRALDAVVSVLQTRWTSATLDDSSATGALAGQPSPTAQAPPDRDVVGTIPLPLTSFIGRERERQEIGRFIRGGTRLVTLTGPGGAGKTRLAIQAAFDAVATFPDGIYLVDLAPLAEPGLLTQSVAFALGLREQPEQPFSRTLIDFLRSRQSLLVLDNCEHLIAACAELVEALLRACPGLQVLATSRESFRISIELNRRVPPLAAPDPDHLAQIAEDLPSTLDQYDAVRLFVERAAAACSDFSLAPANAPAIARICWQLDGIPLAIELAAARTRVLTVEQIAERLGDSLRLLSQGNRTAVPRHQTLRALFDWSHDLLDEAERRLLRRLAVFPADFSLTVAEAVAGAEEDVLALLAGLVDKSLVLVDDRSVEARYRLLETTRQYARERLVAAGEIELIQARNRDFYIGLVERAEGALWGKDQTAWFDRLHAERHNLQLVLAWCREQDSATGLRLVAILWRFWWVRGSFAEGRRWLEGMLSLPVPENAAPNGALVRARGWALLGASFLAREQGDPASAKAHVEESLAVLRVASDDRGTAMALFNLALVLRGEGMTRRATVLLYDALALFRDVGDRWGIGEVLYILGTNARSAGDYTRARAYLEESLRNLREIHEPWGMAWALGSLGNLARLQGDFALARVRYEESLARLNEAGDAWGVGWTLAYLGNLSRAEGDPGRAVAFYRDSLTVFRQRGVTWGIAYVLALLGVALVQQGDLESGVRLIGAASTHHLYATSLAPDERAAVDSSLAASHDALSADAFARAWTEGRETGPERAAATTILLTLLHADT